MLLLFSFCVECHSIFYTFTRGAVSMQDRKNLLDTKVPTLLLLTQLRLKAMDRRKSF